MFNSYLWYSTIALFFGFLLDLILGDPTYFFHPIRLIGNLIAFLEKQFRKYTGNNKNRNLTAGLVLVCIVTALFVLLPFLVLYVFYRIHPWLGCLMETIFCYQLLAVKCLKKESMKVYDSLNKNNLEEARYHVSMIVGRDTEHLNQEEVVKAAVETVAENASDGVIAPLLFMAAGGAVLGFFYKAVNTMDSMIGYKNDKYLYFGRCAAKLDDVLNYIPSRITGILIVLLCPLLGCDRKQAWLIYKRDAGKHASPNSAQSEAACAGALGVQLAGDAYYFGKRVEKPYIGDDRRKIETEDIRRTNQLLYLIACAFVLLLSAVKLLLCFLLL